MKLHILSSSQVDLCYGILLLSNILHQLDKNQFVFLKGWKGGTSSRIVTCLHTKIRLQ